MAPSGVFLLDKPSGISSARAIDRVKHRLKPSKIGHAGTLDPMATGLLVVLIGGATRLAQYAEGGAKEYSGEIRFGITTDSDDITGEVLTRSESIPSFERIAEAVAPFRGAIEQVPPNVSAVNVNGERAYRIARRGEEPALKSRAVRVDRFDIEPVDPSTVRFVVKCSKGTYIRSLARDLGAALGCGGTLGSLRRTRSEPFSVGDARQPEEIEFDHLLPCSSLFPGREILTVSDEEAARLRGGDERMLRILEPRLEGDDPILFRAVSALDIGGVLVRDSGTWRFGVNLS